MGRTNGGSDGIPTGRMKRAVPVAGLAARSAGEAVIGSLRRKSGPPSPEVFVERADRYVELLGLSKGALMKAGQMLSYVPFSTAVPSENRALFQAAMGKLQSNAPPMAPRLAAQVIEDELGVPPERAFAEFSERPIAAASIGQVHVARLHDGRRVAVKVQYPGVAEAIRSDLRNAELLAVLFQLLRSVVPGLTRVDPHQIALEISERITEELDYRIEARNQQQFADAYRGHPFYFVPDIISERSSTRVLTQEFAEGLAWPDALKESQELRNQWGEAIFRFAFGSLRLLNTFNVDPHPGNYLFRKDGSVAFLDFGCVKRFEPDQVFTIREMVRAVLRQDAGALWHGFVEMGVLDGKSGPTPEEVLEWYSGPFAMILGPQPYTITPQLMGKIIHDEFSPTGPSAKIVRSLKSPRDLVFMTRIDLGLMSVLAELRAASTGGNLPGARRGCGSCHTDGRGQRRVLRAKGGPRLVTSTIERPTWPVSQGDPYGALAGLRSRGPVHFIEEIGAFLVVSHPMAKAILGDAEWSADPTKNPRLARRFGISPIVAETVIAKSVLFTDPPDHTRLRRSVGRFFAPKAIEDLRGRIAAIVEAAFSGHDRDAPIDMIRDVATAVPLAVICELLDAPIELAELLRSETPKMIGMLDPLAERELIEIGVTAAMTVMLDLIPLVAEKTEHPGPDLLSSLVQEVDGEAGLASDESLVMVLLLLAAGHETTANLVANAVVVLHERPDVVARLRSDRSLIPAGVEELLRFESPVQVTSRVATKELELAGLSMGPGQQVLLSLGGANRDPGGLRRSRHPLDAPPAMPEATLPSATACTSASDRSWPASRPKRSSVSSSTSTPHSRTAPPGFNGARRAPSGEWPGSSWAVSP